MDQDVDPPKIKFMNKLVLGTAQFGLHYGIANRTGQVSKEETGRILKRAEEAGIDTLDTAIAYGTSEDVLGEIGVSNFQVITKIPDVPETLSSIEKWIEDQLQNSLSRLGVQSLYGVLLHRSENLRQKFGRQLVHVLERLKGSGLIQKIGVSIYEPKELEFVYQEMPLDLVQAPLNLLDRRLETSGWLERLHSQNIEIHTRSAFLQGLLLLPRDQIPEKFERWANLWNAWHAQLQQRNKSALETCLNYPLSLHQVSKVVVGIDSSRQLGELLAIANNPAPFENCSMMASNDEDLINPSKWNLL